MKWYHFLKQTKINSKWIKDLNVRPEAIKPLGKNIGIMLFDISLSIFFFFDVSSGKGNKSKNKHMGLYQTKKVCTAKETINKTKRPPTEWENIFANDVFNKKLISRI